MRRRLFTILSACSLLLFVAVAVMWVRSYWQGSLLGWSGRQHTLLTRTEHGVMAISWHRTDAGAEPGLLYAAWPHPPGLNPPNLPAWPHSLWFDYAEGGTRGGNVIRRWRVPCWSGALAGGLFPGAWAVAYVRQRQRAMDGGCPRCGYDLRATPERCPECGH